MEDNKIYASEFIELNKEYLELQSEIDSKIKEDLINNRDIYPVGAEELYFFDYKQESEDCNEDKIALIDGIIMDRFKDDYNKLYELRDKIVGFIGHIEQDPKEYTSEDWY